MNSLIHHSNELEFLPHEKNLRRWLQTKQAAEYLGVTVRSLQG